MAATGWNMGRPVARLNRGNWVVAGARCRFGDYGIAVADWLPMEIIHWELSASDLNALAFPLV